jgi:hypothetical protein
MSSMRLPRAGLQGDQSASMETQTYPFGIWGRSVAVREVNDEIIELVALVPQDWRSGTKQHSNT